MGSRSDKSPYSAFVASSLRSTALISSKSLNINRKRLTKRRSSSQPVNTHNFDIDEEISYVAITVTFRNNNSIEVYDPSSNNISSKSRISEVAIFTIEDPIPGEWKLVVTGYPDSYSYDIAISFKKPIAFHVNYLFEERRGKFIVLDTPLLGKRTI